MDHILKKKKPKTKTKIGKRKMNDDTTELNISTGSIRDVNEEPIKSKKSFKVHFPDKNHDLSNTRDSEDYENLMERMNMSL